MAFISRFILLDSHPLFVKGNRDLCSYVRRASKNRSNELPNSQLTQGLASSYFPAVDSSTQYMTTDSCPDFGHLPQSKGGNDRKGLPPSLRKGPKSQGGTSNITGAVKGDSPLGVIPGQDGEITGTGAGYDFEFTTLLLRAARN
jgi:hypothetical protein